MAAYFTVLSKLSRAFPKQKGICILLVSFLTQNMFLNILFLFGVNIFSKIFGLHGNLMEIWVKALAVQNINKKDFVIILFPFPNQIRFCFWKPYLRKIKIFKKGWELMPCACAVSFKSFIEKILQSFEWASIGENLIFVWGW